jgi:outer membrane protein
MTSYPPIHAENISKIAVVDFQYVLRNSKAGQEIQSKILKKGEALKSELKEKQDDIKEMQERFKEESPILSNDARVKKERELGAALNEYRILQRQNTQEFNELRAELINDLKETIVDFARKTGESQGFSLIIERQSGNILYAKDSLEITDQFVDAVDSENNTESK